MFFMNRIIFHNFRWLTFRHLVWAVSSMPACIHLKWSTMCGAQLSPISAPSPGSDLGFSILVLVREARSVSPRLSLHLTSIEKIWWVPDVWCGGGSTHRCESLSSGGVWQHKPAASGFWKIRGRIEGNCTQWPWVPWITAGGGQWHLRNAACFAVGCSCGRSQLLGEGSSVSAFKHLLCNCSCINKSFMLGLVFMGLTE